MGSINTVGSAQPSTSESTDVLRQLKEGISRQNQRIEETNKLARQEFDRKKEKGDERKDILSKLHSYFLHMLLNASSTDGDRAAKEITSVCRSFDEAFNNMLRKEECIFDILSFFYSSFSSCYQILALTGVGS